MCDIGGQRERCVSKKAFAKMIEKDSDCLLGRYVVCLQQNNGSSIWIRWKIASVFILHHQSDKWAPPVNKICQMAAGAGWLCLEWLSVM